MSFMYLLIWESLPFLSFFRIKQSISKENYRASIFSLLFTSLVSLRLLWNMIFMPQSKDILTWTFDKFCFCFLFIMAPTSLIVLGTSLTTLFSWAMVMVLPQQCKEVRGYFLCQTAKSLMFCTKGHQGYPDSVWSLQGYTEGVHVAI